ncbi:MAG: phosphatase PAP2 family protein [Bacteroidales bacterium]|nr:phosphatase PAP2 family protein [Bacteroidales bacterium]
MYFSFPSGHATSAFALFFCLAVLVHQNSMKLLFFMSALLISFSRVYLSQHFLLDVYVGSFIGLIISILFCKWIYLSENIQLNKPLLTVFRKQNEQ